MYNDADLERELELLAEEEIKDDMINIVPLPDVPNQTISAASRNEADNQSDDLRKLEEWVQ